MTPPARHALSGTVAITFHGASEVIELPIDPAEAGVVVWEPSAPGSTELALLQPSSASLGTFAFDDVAGEPVYVRFDDTLAHTAADGVDLGLDVAGRQGIAGAAPGTSFTYELAGLAPWSQDDVIFQWCANHGFFWGVAQDDDIATGAESASVAANQFIAVDDQQGDRLTLVHYQTRRTSPMDYLVAAAAVDLAPVSTVDGAQVSVEAPLAAIPATGEIDLEIGVAAFWAQQANVHLEAFALGLSVDVVAMPPGAARLYDGAPVIYSRAVNAGQTLALPGLAYRNPFPPEWPLMLRIIAPYAKQVALPNASPGYVFAELAIVSEVGPEMAQNIVIAPVRQIRVNDLSAIGELSNVSTTPRISWGRPLIGAATGYVVTLYHLTEADGTTTDERVLEVVTTSTEIVVPPGYLIEGEPYLVRVDALAMPNTDLSTTPHRRSLPFAIAGSFSGLVRP